MVESIYQRRGVQATSSRADGMSQRQTGGKVLQDNRESSQQLKQLMSATSASAVQSIKEGDEPLQGQFAGQQTAQLEQPAASKPNHTGLPDNLKTGIESLSGMSMDNVRVHYNSAKPTQLNALAYAQGTDIHVASGQERHLPHEAWHVVQQAQGSVRPTMQMKESVSVNDDKGLEREAHVMGAKAVSGGVVQRKSMESDPIDSIMVMGSRAATMQAVMAGATTTSLREDVVQRVKDAKKSIAQPAPGMGGADGSAAVPDLPNALVIEINGANTVTKRKNVLKNLKTYLDGNEAISNTTTDGSKTYGVTLAYDDGLAEAGTTIALARTVRIEIGPGAFDNAAKLYSVLRHELIHAAQRIDWPDQAQTNAGDHYFFEDGDPNSVTNQLQNPDFTDVRRDIMLGVQEVETHTWELDHAAQTGIDDAYYRETVGYLIGYINAMDATVRNLYAAGNRQNIIDYWTPYIQSACEMAEASLNRAITSGRLTQQQMADAQLVADACNDLDVFLV